MSKELLSFENAIRPVTALNFFEFENVYLAAGEGQDIKIFDHQTGSQLATHRIFKSENIHGIASCISRHGDQDHRARLLVWGGRSLSLVELFKEKSTDGAPLKFDVVLAETRTGDWILDVCFHPLASEAHDLFSPPFEAVAITAHNQLRSLRFLRKDCLGIQDVATDDEDLAVDRQGPQSNALLYSAHIYWSRANYVEGCILVAVGTVFGEVHLWSSEYDRKGKHGALRLHYTFTGHLGSVFGVRIFEKINVEDGSMIRLLASCSDDRTIRIWDISELKKSHAIGESTQCLAAVMGHASRIWAVRLLQSFDDKVQLLSLGEDGTAQVWFLQPAPGKESQKTGRNDYFELAHDTKYHDHFGKNIWAVATLEKRNGATLIATGGADGRIVSYQRGLSNVDVFTGAMSYQSTTDQVAETCKITSTFPEADISTKAIFDALQGQWKLSRTLQSALATYPSGTLNGVAKVESRQVTDPDFSQESFYSEEGDFVTDKNFKMRAKRQYAYRFQESLNEFSAWFVKPNGHGLVDYLFHHLEFITSESRKYPKEGDTTIVTAKGHHLCVNDEYNADYTFRFVGQTLENWSLKYVVKGPEKDYVADATYSRPIQEEEGALLNSRPDHNPKANGTMQGRSTEIGAFKSYAWISDTQFLTITDLGNVLIGTPHAHQSTDEEVASSLPALSWELVGHIDGLSSSYVISNVYSFGATFIIGTTGKVFCYYSRSRTLEFVVALQQKPNFLKAQEVRTMKNGVEDEECGALGSMFKSAEMGRNQYWISLVTTSIASQKAIVSIHPCDEHVTPSAGHQFSIQLPKGFIVTSSCLLDKGTSVLLGSRNGSLLIYDPLRELAQSIFTGIHGIDAITDIQILPESQATSSNRTSWILTTGRDGKFAVHQITFFNIDERDRKPELETFHESALPFGPNIEGAHVDSTNHDLLLWGFHSTQFVVWNETRKTVAIAIECGGAHRHWAYRPLNDGKGGGNFVWTKASVCNVHTQTEASHTVLQFGGHGREIKALAVARNWKRSDGTPRCVIATGAEDTAIRLFEYDPVSGYRCVRIITKHTTGIQKLQWVGRNDEYLFSAAGCEEFFMWKVSEVPCLGIGITCVLVCPNVTEDKDLRVMDFAVTEVQNLDSTAKEGAASVQLIAMVYSDSSVRISVFRKAECGKHILTFLLEGSYTTHCLTQVEFVNLSSETYLCTASTDGHLAFWPLTKGLANHGFHFSEGSLIYLEPNTRLTSPLKEISWQKRFPVHQNSIKCLVHVRLSSKMCLILTCSDDQALALVCIAVEQTVSAACDWSHAILLLPNAHSSAVTALAYLISTSTETQTLHKFGSVGNDQQLQIWEIIDKMHGEGVERFSIRKTMHVHSSIADASALSTFSMVEQEPIRLCVAGIGLEAWSIEEKSHQQ